MPKKETRGRPQKQPLIVSDQQREELEQIVKQRRERRLVFRARIILRCSAGQNDSEVAGTLRTTNGTVGYWRRRFSQGGVDALWDEPRPGAPRQIGDEKVQQAVELVLQSKPAAATHWSTRLMAQKLNLSQSAVSRIWRAFGLKPHRHETFQISTDPFFIEKVRDIVGLYLSPPTHALVLCVDEKSQIQALNRTQPVLPLRPAQVERHTPEYQRNGTTSLFAALDVATGHVIGKCFRRHRTAEFKRFLNQVDAAVPPELEMHLILDNYATHKTAAVREWVQRHPRYHLHFTPTHSSWINQVERWFALLSQRQIKRGSHHTVRELESAIAHFIKAHNQNPKPFAWTKSADQILESLRRFAAETIKIHTD